MTESTTDKLAQMKSVNEIFNSKDKEAVRQLVNSIDKVAPDMKLYLRTKLGDRTNNPYDEEFCQEMISILDKED